MGWQRPLDNIEGKNGMGSGFALTFLLDTNIFIPLEPTELSSIERGMETAARLNRLCSSTDVRVFLHPMIREDIESDADEKRRTLRKSLLLKYPLLPSPPSLNTEITDILGIPDRNHNNWVDFHLLAALKADAVGFLITEDNGIHKWGKRLGLAERVVRMGDAIDIVERLLSQHPTPPPAVELKYAHELNSSDPIFDSLRDDYGGKNFDNWLAKCKQNQRHAWTVTSAIEKKLAGICIIKDEDPPENGLTGNVVKMCCFKISDKARGKRYGELLLKAVFDYAAENGADWIYTTVLPKHEFLLQYLADFGFCYNSRTDKGDEFVVRKAMKPGLFPGDASLSPLNYHIRYGPRVARFTGISRYCIPIQPRYTQILFPEGEQQLSLLQGEYAFGNSIRKAYLCHSGMSGIQAGDFLAFYRSHIRRGLFAFGIVEDVLRSAEADQLTAFVGKRTVYNYRTIEAMCSDRRSVLAILFRQASVLSVAIGVEELKSVGIFKTAPMSIQRIGEGYSEWLAVKAKMQS